MTKQEYLVCLLTLCLGWALHNALLTLTSTPEKAGDLSEQMLFLQALIRHLMVIRFPRPLVELLSKTLYPETSEVA